MTGIRNHGHMVNTNKNCSYQKERCSFLLLLFFAVKIDYDKKIPFIVCMRMNFYIYDFHLVLFTKI